MPANSLISLPVLLLINTISSSAISTQAPPPPSADSFRASMQAIVDAKAKKYNCSVALGLRWHDMSLEVAAGTTDRASGRKAQPDDVVSSFRLPRFSPILR